MRCVLAVLYTVCDFVMVRSKVNYVRRPLGVSIFSNVAPFEKGLDTPDIQYDVTEEARNCYFTKTSDLAFYSVIAREMGGGYRKGGR